jgi:excisionase family DNA binding protein
MMIMNDTITITDLVSVGLAADIVGLNLRLVYRHIENRDLPAHRIGRMVVVSKQDLAEWKRRYDAKEIDRRFAR